MKNPSVWICTKASYKGKRWGDPGCLDEVGTRGRGTWATAFFGIFLGGRADGLFMKFLGRICFWTDDFVDFCWKTASPRSCHFRSIFLIPEITIPPHMSDKIDNYIQRGLWNFMEFIRFSMQKHEHLHVA